MEHKGDLIDQATAQEEAFRELALRGVAGKAARETHPDFDGENCMDCELPIEEGRLRLGYITCIHCKTQQEAQEKRTRR